MNRLKEETSVFDIDYTYDSMGNRTQEVEGAVTTNYTYSNMMRLLSKTEGNVSTTFGYDRNGNLTSKTEGNSSYAYVWDYDNRLKEVRQNGNLLFSYTYDPNGRRVRSLNSGTGTEKYTFTGQFIEAEIGLYYFGARWYDASLGRFISEDPIKGSMTSSQSQNPYVYCMNNPLRFVDPTGMLMSDPHPYVPGTIQTYYGGEWHYYSDAGGVVDSSGPGMNYTQAKDAYDKRVKDDFYAKQDQSYFDRAEKLLRSTMTRYYWNSKGMLDWYNQQTSGNPGEITSSVTGTCLDPFHGDPLTGLPLWWWTGGNKMTIGGIGIVAGGITMTGAVAGVAAGAVTVATGVWIPLRVAIWAG